ncbi:MAG: MFS transporter [Acetobacteraceae bacterium]|nr:MFS transporter [Acetobacteraceae bacterium]
MTSRRLRGLDWLNFFVADVQTGFGPFIAVYLTARHWTQGDIGLALSIGTIAAAISQVPAGAIVDAVPSKRMTATFGILTVTLTALIFALWPLRLSVYIAEVMHGFASCLLVPSIAAISLALVGHKRLGERLGRNARFAGVGNGIAAAVMGAIGAYFSTRAVFWLTAALAIPAIIALRMIGRVRVPPALEGARIPPGWAGLRELFTDRALIVFFACAFLFHLSNAAMLPLAAAEVTKKAEGLANVIIAACIVVPQICVALLSPWVGRTAHRVGRRRLMLLGWLSLPVRGLLMAAFPDPWVLVALQVFSGVSAAVFGVMLPLISADVTRGSNRFNLCMGTMGLAVFGGATVSTSMAGWLADSFNEHVAFLGLSAAGLLGVLLIWAAMPETKEDQAEEPITLIRLRPKPAMAFIPPRLAEIPTSISGRAKWPGSGTK